MGRDMYSRRKPSPAEFSRLVQVRRAYLMAWNSGNERHDPAARNPAVVLIDFAIEAAMKLAVEVLGNNRVARDFPSVLNQLDVGLEAAALPPLAARSMILEVHDLRNASQHRARYPNDTEMAECVIYSRDSLREVVRTVWGEDFDRISLSQLVRNEYSRRLLHEAETAVEAGDWVGAVSKAAYAVEDALQSVSTYLTPHLDFDVERLEESELSADLVRAFSNVARLVGNTVVAASLGLDLKALRRINLITGDWTTSGGTNILYHHIRPHLAEVDALFVLDAALDALLKIEAQVGDLRQPFGFNISVADAIDEVFAQHAIPVLQSLPAMPDDPYLSFDRQTVDDRPLLRHHRAVAVLRRASLNLDPTKASHASLLSVIEQYIVVVNSLSHEFDEQFETLARRLLVAIDFMVSLERSL
jgi:hypothetical protein